MKVLIVSDTHGRDENLERAVMMETPFDMLVHCGDVEGREIFIEALVECPCWALLWRVDGYFRCGRRGCIQRLSGSLFRTYAQAGH